MSPSKVSPSNDGVQIASLKTINFAGLERKDEGEIQKLMEASIAAGFFYLDFENSGAASLPNGKQEVLKLMETYFNQPIETKNLDSQGKTTRGYVSGGTFSAVDRQKPNESFEHLAIGTHELRQNGAKELPAVFQQQENVMQNYIKTCEYVVDVMLSCMSSALGLEGDMHLEHMHRHDKPSDTILAMLSYPGQLTHQKHTDIGSLTVLFSDQWGLQVVAPETGNWEWVEPRERDAVINVGDTLRFFSGKKLYSCVHRVIRGGIASETSHRYSIAYLLRPDNDARFDDADGSHTTAEEFVRKKYDVYSAPHDEQEKNTYLTGGMEQTLGVKA